MPSHACSLHFLRCIADLQDKFIAPNRHGIHVCDDESSGGAGKPGGVHRAGTGGDEGDGSVMSYMLENICYR